MPEALETLSGDLSVFVGDAQPVTTDSLLLARFCAPKHHEICCDLGCGCGLVPLLWAAEAPPKHITGIELRKNAVRLFERSVEKNGLSSLITPCVCDLRNSAALPGKGTFNLVSMNPPYRQTGSGTASANNERSIARTELCCTLSDIANAAWLLLKNGGRFCLCHKPERLCDVITALRETHLEPKKLQFVQKDPNAKPSLFLLEAKKGGKAGLTVLPPLYTNQSSLGV